MMNKTIGPFKLYEKEPNDIQYGSLYYKEFSLPLPSYRKRIVRIYLPEDFDINETYPVMYMADGQNIVDKFTTAFGAWDIDVRQHELIQEGYLSFIVVGIDCPKGDMERTIEYSFPHLKVVNVLPKVVKVFDKKECFSHLLYKYIAEELHPLICSLFKIDQRYVACGGASMGGVFSMSLMTSYPNIFNYALCFSPAFYLYDQEKMDGYMLKAMSFIKDKKISLYSGGVGFERLFVEPTKRMYSFLKDNGLNEKQLQLIIDLSQQHHESAWTKYFNDAVKFWLEEFNK